ncbi:MAG: acyltransferase [Acidimicrobiia bacterium]|nr:acyltransferase [Acidimicrobiia bacterium]
MLRPGHRADIDGWRAIAVLLVVGYHVGLPGFAGGFVGVDVFFVLSGYLITRQLWSEAERHGTIDVLGFWGRRVRRLVPAAAVMVVAVVAVAAMVASPLAWDATSGAAVASSLSLSNVWFGMQSADYFAADVAANPLLHTWSLAVEEQFYLVWPVLLLALAGRRRRTWVLSVGLVSALSFWLGLVLTARGTPWAFYASPARAWELGLGALVALVWVHSPVAVPRLRLVVAGVGVAAVVSSVLLFDATTAFPGAWALLPAGGTAMVLAADASILRPVLSVAPAQWLGRLSYGWYLWHWPVLVFGAALAGPLGSMERTVLAAASLVLAMVMHRLVEQPVRFSPVLARSTGRSMALGGVLTAVVVMAVMVGSAEIDDRLRDPDVRVLAAAQEDVPDLADAECETLDLDHLLATCTARPERATPAAPILLLGDSHAGHWQPALETGAVSLGRPLVTSWRGNCPAIPVQVTVEGRRSSECGSRQDGVLALVEALSPAAVVLSHSGAYEVSDDEWRDGLAALVDELELRDIPVGVVLDIPRQGADPVHCAAVHGLEAACTVDRVSAESQLASVHERELDVLLASGHGVAFDPLPVLCDSDECPLVVDDVVTYRDSNHLTATFAQRLSPDLEHWLATEVLPG